MSPRAVASFLWIPAGYCVQGFVVRLHLPLKITQPPVVDLIHLTLPVNSVSPTANWHRTPFRPIRACKL